jgi:hypothetical protein
MSDHDWARVQAIRAALDEGRTIDPADLYWLCDACGAPPAQTPRVFTMTPQLRLWLWAAGDSILMPTAA